MTYLPILTYHRLLSKEPTRERDPKRIAVSQSQFRRHLTLLRYFGYHTLSLANYVRALRTGQKPSARHFAITFDDGYEDVLTLGLPVLQEFGYTATIFAVPGQEQNRWDDGSAKLLTENQLRQWHAAGMEVGGHTCQHVHLTRVSPNIARQEIGDSKTRLENILGQGVTTFAYPYGESNDTVEAMVREAGYEAGFSTDQAPRNHAEHLFRLRRAVVFPRNTAWEILWKTQRWYPAYQDWKRR